MTYEKNENNWKLDPFYSPSGHPKLKGVPSKWDARRDPFHTRGELARTQPTDLHMGERMPLAVDLVERAQLASNQGVEGSWGDRASFLRVHHLVRDKYRQAVVDARTGRTDTTFSNGVI